MKKISRQSTTGVFAESWSIAARSFGGGGELRTLVRGQRTNHEWAWSHYTEHWKLGDRPVSVQLVFQQEGGGSKADAAVKLKDEFTARVLQLGFDPIETKSFVIQLYQEAGAARLRHTMAIQEEEAFLKQCAALAQQTRTKMPERFDLEAERNKRIRAMWKNGSQEPSPIHPGELTIEPGTFSRPDDTEVSMQKSPGPNMPGIVFVAAEDIVAFAKQVRTDPPEELLAIVPGTTCPMHDKTCNRLNLLVRNQEEEKIIIAACCHSIGKNPIKQKVSPGDGAKITESSKVMFVAWRQECGEDLWAQIQEAPIQTIFKRIQVVPSETIAGAPVGRSWRANRQAAEPQEAEGFCFYARVLASMLTTVLKKSGIDGIYTTPKSEHSTLADSRFSVLWLHRVTPEQAREQAEKVDCALGLVRSSKAQPSYGIRLWAKDFDTVWAALKPGESKPTQMPGEFLYKISPVPAGATAEDIQAWIELEKLPAKPLRALGSTTWLLKGQAQLSRQYLTWKRNAIVLTPIESKYNRSSQTILAGASQPVRTKRIWKNDSKSNEQADPLTLADPWAKASMDLWSNDPWWPTPSVSNHQVKPIAHAPKLRHSASNRKISVP